MTDYEYILQQAKLFHYKGWEDGELRKCVDMLSSLSRQELVALYRSKWISDGKIIKQTIFNILFKDQVGKREERIKNLPTEELLEEFKDKKSGNIALIRNEMKARYKENESDDRIKIAFAFKDSSPGDQNWIEHQERKELYGEKKKK